MSNQIHFVSAMQRKWNLNQLESTNTTTLDGIYNLLFDLNNLAKSLTVKESYQTISPYFIMT